MKKLKSGDKVVQKMTRDGAVELNKTTGSAASISTREAETNSAGNVQNPGGEIMPIVGGAVDRVQAERRSAAKKRMVKRANAQIYERSQPKPQNSRLKFTDAERADPALARNITKADKAATVYDKAQAQLQSGKLSNGKLKHALERPAREVTAFVHSKVSQVEGENTGIKAAHSAEKAAEQGARKLGEGYRRLKFLPQRAAFRAEEKLIKANARALYERSLRLNPQLRKANPITKAWHKRKIKREYARQFRQGSKGVTQAAGAAKRTLQRAGSAALQTLKRVKTMKILALFGGILLMLALLVTCTSSCMAMMSGGLNTIIGTSFTAEDEDIHSAHGDFVSREAALAERIANVQTEFPGYDEYRFYLDPIEHDPFMLISYLTARFQDFRMDDPEVQAAIAALFERQYVLTFTSITETRTRIETRTGIFTDSYGNLHIYTYTVEVVYEWRILITTLENRTMLTAALENLTPEQAEMFFVYMETQGNRPDLFTDSPYAAASPYTANASPYIHRGNYFHYAIPPEALNDYRFAAMITEAEQFLGFPYVWGGSNPATGFDCSGFVSWVINQSGVGNVGRMTANGLYNHTITVPASEAQPGDLVFFQGTTRTRGASHVGIYVGGGMMIHTGGTAGVEFSSINSNFWQNHFKAFGRLPE